MENFFELDTALADSGINKHPKQLLASPKKTAKPVLIVQLKDPQGGEEPMYLLLIKETSPLRECPAILVGLGGSKGEFFRRPLVVIGHFLTKGN